MRSLLLCLFACLALSACESNDADTAPGDAVTYATDADSAMNGAIEQARRTMSEFETVLKNPDSTQKNFAVKVALPHSAGVEHIWLAKPEMETDSVVGTVETMPMYVKTVTAGQRVRIDRDVISDWMYMENGKLRGGYTMRIALDELPEKERAAHKKALGLD